MYYIEGFDGFYFICLLELLIFFKLFICMYYFIMKGFVYKVYCIFYRIKGS